MELKEKIKVMQHYLDGGKVECRLKGEDNWLTLSRYYWNWHSMDYRIKEVKQEITIEEWLMQSTIDEEYRIIETSLVDKFVNFKKVKLLGTYKIELKENK